jgi:uncharacterized protein YcgI (DUF1989 family)
MSGGAPALVAAAAAAALDAQKKQADAKTKSDLLHDIQILYRQRADKDGNYLEVRHLKGESIEDLQAWKAHMLKQNDYGKNSQ